MTTIGSWDIREVTLDKPLLLTLALLVVLFPKLKSQHTKPDSHE